MTNIDRVRSLLNTCFANPEETANEPGETKRLRVRVGICVVRLQNEVLARTYGKASRCTSISPPLTHKLTQYFDSHTLSFSVRPQIKFLRPDPSLPYHPSQASGNVIMPSALQPPGHQRTSWSTTRRVSGRIPDGFVHRIYPIAIANRSSG